MTNRYPLIIDAADKKLKELPVGDNLRVDGDIITQGNLIGNVTGDVVGNLTGNVVGDIDGNLTGNVDGNLTGNVDGNLTGNVTGSVFSINNALIVNGTNGTIPYTVLTDTPVIPTDISQLTDNQGLLDQSGSNGASTFLELTDTPNVYNFGSNKFLKVNSSETAVEFGEISTQDIEVALGYTPYNGLDNPLGFIDSENDTLDSVLQRGNNTNRSISVDGISSSSLISTSITARNFLEFFDNDETNQFDISIETNKTLSIANRLTVNTNTNTVNVLNSEFLGNNSSIGSTSSFWGSAYVNDANVESLRSKPNANIGILTERGVEISLGFEPLVPAPTGAFPQSFDPANKFKISGKGTFQLPTLLTAERDALTPEAGDMIYNVEVGTVQAYAVTGYTGGGSQILGWVNLYDPPAPPP